MENHAEKRNTSSANDLILGISLFNAVYSAYIVNYEPKIGVHHIWICSVLGVLLTVFSVRAFVQCGSRLKKGVGNQKLTVVVLITAVLMFIMWMYSTLPYYKDLVSGSETVTTDSYLVVRDTLYFLNNEGNEVKLTISKDTANEFRAKENYEYDYENNLIKYYDEITVTYFPNSKVLISTLADD